MNNKILIIGIDSMVGNALGTALASAGYEIFGTSRRKTSDHAQLDVTWELDNWPVLPECDSLVVCASVNKVEQCQSNPALSYMVNVEGLEKAIRKYKSLQTKVCFFSSSHVFNGRKPFCREDESPDPQNVLGEHKVLGEEIVLREGGLVMRLTKVIDPCFPRFTHWIQRLKNGEPIEAYNNLLASLVPLDSLVKIMTTAIRDNWSGIVHISGPEDRSYTDIAKILARGLGYAEDLVLPVKGEGELIGRAHTYTTLRLSERVRALNVELPDTETVVCRWCRDFISI